MRKDETVPVECPIEELNKLLKNRNEGGKQSDYGKFASDLVSGVQRRLKAEDIAAAPGFFVLWYMLDEYMAVTYNNRYGSDSSPQAITSYLRREHLICEFQSDGKISSSRRELTSTGDVLVQRLIGLMGGGRLWQSEDILASGKTVKKVFMDAAHALPAFCELQGKFCCQVFNLR